MSIEARQLPSPEALRLAMTYSPVTGLLTWRARGLNKTWDARFPGTEALGTLSKGYKQGRFHGAIYKAHRVAFAIHYERWPEGEVDHINGNRTDNRIANLREVTGAENKRNAALKRTNTSGVAGVYRSGRGWRAQIQNMKIGTFNCFGQALAARRAEEANRDFHPNHGRRKSA